MLEILNILFKIVILNPSNAKHLINHQAIESILKKIVFSNFLNNFEIFGVLIVRLLFLFYLSSLFIAFMVNCSNYIYKNGQSNYITRFPSKLDNNTQNQVGIPFCSVLYKPEKQYDEFTAAGWFNYVFCWIYFGFEILCIAKSKISRLIRELILEFCENIWEILKIIITVITLTGAFFLGSYIFQVYVGLLTNKADKFFEFFKNLKKANKYYGDTLVIQVKNIFINKKKCMYFS
jgi:hypothetical protein